MRSDDGFQHEMHHQRAHHPFVKAREPENARRAIIADQRLGGCPLFGIHQIAHGFPGEVAKSLIIDQGGLDNWTRSGTIQHHHREHFIAGPVEIELQLAVLVDGTEWVDFGWGFDGEQFGESTYRYELAITPITSLPNDASATPDQAVVFDLGENEIIHTSITVGDFDEACTECVLESYQGFWTMSPEMCCTGTNDVVLAEMEPSLASAASTAVESVSWGQIKAAY